MVETNAQGPDTLLDLLFEDGEIGRCLVAPDGSVVRANRQWLGSVGLSREQVIGADVLRLVPEAKETAAALHARARAGHAVEVPPHARWIGSRETWWAGTIQPVAMEGGTGLLLTTREVAPPGGTGRGEAIAGLQSAELLEGTFAAMGQGVVVYGPGGELLRMNAAAERILGVSKARWAAERGPEGRAALVQLQTAGAAPMPLEETPIWRALHGQPSEAVELRIRTPGGEPRWVSASAAPIRGPDGASLGTVGTFTDVTERKEAEQALVESELKLRVSFAHAAIGFARTTVDGRFLDVNPAYCTITGYSPEELRATSLAALVHPDDRAANMRQIDRMVRGEISDFVVENRYLRKQGGAVWVRKSVSIVRRAAGEPPWIIALVEDVTEQKRIEQALRESEQRFRLALRNAPVSVAAQDRDLRFVWAYNQRTARPDQVVGKLDEEIFTAEEAARLGAIKRRVLTEAVEHREQMWLDRPGGRVFVDVYFEPLRDEMGQVVGVGTATVDLTAMKLAEEALRANESILRAILNATTESVWLFDAAGVVLAANQTGLARMGRPAEAILGKRIQELLPEELASSRLARLREVIDSGRPVVFEDVRAGTRFEHTFYPAPGADGRVDRVAAFSRDITARRRAEEALRRYELVANHSRDIILFLRRDGRILEANLAAEATYGHTREELRGLSILDLRAHEASALAADQMAQAEAGGILFETVHRRKDGTTFPVEVSSQGAVVAGERTLVSVIRDITQRRLAEESLHGALRQLAGERDRLSVTLRSIGDAVIATDEAGRVELFNAVAEQLTGWKAEEARGRPIQEVFTIIDEESRLPAESPVGRVLREGVTLGLANHTALVARDGTERPVADSAAPIRDAQGRVTGVVLVFRDQTEERRAERVLQESEARLRLLAEVLPQLVWTGDEKGNLDFFNQRWRDYTGQPKGAEEWEPALHPEDRERVVALWREAVGRQAAFEIEHRLRRADGEFRWFLRRAILLSHPDGAGGRWFGTCTDIHDLKISQDMLRQADRLKEDFLSMASHEFRNPLTALRLQVELLARRLRKATAPEAWLERQLAVVEAQIDRMEGLLGMLLDVSRINAGRFALELAELDLAELTREAVERFRPEVEATGTELRVRADGVKGRWDRMRLDQVVTNLVSNAIKYGNRLPVEVEVAERGDAAVLVVRDHGIGIQPESLAAIFERFERGGNVGAVQGLGLGLWIVRKLVEAHGGEVSVASIPGAGSTFTVVLPRSAPFQARPE
jgi:PAS domain S-box-containing protein